MRRPEIEQVAPLAALTGAGAGGASGAVGAGCVLTRTCREGGGAQHSGHWEGLHLRAQFARQIRDHLLYFTLIQTYILLIF